jgi:hypothetical protein
MASCAGTRQACEALARVACLLDPGPDAGLVAPDVTDAGTTPPDAGTTPPDAGTTPPDAGTTPPDAGTTPPDAGTTPPDAGTTPPDAGTTPPDAGTTPPDDAGTTPPDAGTTPSDAGTAAQDGGPSDAGIGTLALIGNCSAPTGSYLPGAPTVGSVYLRAEPCIIPANTFDNPAPITMWGFIRTDSTFTAPVGATVQVPGPALAATAGSSLVIHVKNNLSGSYVEPVSLVIPGQTSVMAPVWIDPATGNVTSAGARRAGDYTSRVRSFAAEAAPGGDTCYTFSNLRPGTYLYESGTHPSVQVQMGLYGALIVNPATANQAYDDSSSAYTSQATLLFSEIDSVFHAAIAAGKYGRNPLAPNAPPPGWLTSTIGYHPDYFLVNGLGYRALRPPLAGGTANSPMLLRFLNAGLATKVPELSGPALNQGESSAVASTYLSLIAEDGNFIQVTGPTGLPLAAPRQQTGLMLAAGKTSDALIRPQSGGDLAVIDRRLDLTNGGISPGGQLAFISIAGGAGGGGAGGGTQVLAVSPSTLAFGNVTAGQAKTMNVTVSNLGVASRVLNTAQIVTGGTSPRPADFQMAVLMPVTIPGGGSATLPVTFRPSGVFASTATLQIATSDPSSPTLVIPLNGTGQ